MLLVGEIRPNSRQPRLVLSEERLAALAATVREQGALQPLLVRPVPGGLEVVAGEWRRAGLGELPVVVRDLTDDKDEEAFLIENLLGRQQGSVIASVAS